MIKKQITIVPPLNAIKVSVYLEDGGSIVSETKEFKVASNVFKRPVQLFWLNGRGGYTSQNFGIEYNQSKAVQSISGLTNIGGVQTGFKKPISKTEPILVTTTLFDDLHLESISEIIESPEVYWYKNGVLLPISVLTKEHVIKNNSLIQVSVSFILSQIRKVHA